MHGVLQGLHVSWMSPVSGTLSRLCKFEAVLALRENEEEVGLAMKGYLCQPRREVMVSVGLCLRSLGLWFVSGSVVSVVSYVASGWKNYAGSCPDGCATIRYTTMSYCR